MGEVQECGDAVPPAAGGGLARGGVEEEAALRGVAANVVGVASGGDAAVFWRVHRHVRAHPEDDLEAHAVELVAHSLGIGEAARVELPRAVGELPGVVDHEDAGRTAVRQHRARVFEDAFLVLVVGELDPGVVLRSGEEEQGRNGAGRREMRVGGGSEGIAERCTTLGHHDRGLAVVGREADLAAADLDETLACAPDGAALVGDEERCALVVVVVLAQVDRLRAVCRERHAGAEVVGGAPPVLAGRDAHGRGVCGKAAGDDGGGKKGGNAGWFHASSIAYRLRGGNAGGLDTADGTW